MENKVVVRGHCHQGNPIFGANAGAQCTAIALIVLLSATLQPVSEWRPHDITQVLFDGTAVHSQIISEIYPSAHASTMLLHNDLPSHLEYRGQSFRLQYIVDQFAGVLGQENVRIVGDPSTSFIESVEVGSALSSHMLLTIGSTTVALVCHGDTFYIIDSHGRDSNGRAASDGVAVMMCFNSVQELHSYLISIYSNMQFNLTPVCINVDMNFEAIDGNSTPKKARVSSSQNAQHSSFQNPQAKVAKHSFIDHTCCKSDHTSYIETNHITHEHTYCMYDNSDHVENISSSFFSNGTINEQYVSGLNCNSVGEHSYTKNVGTICDEHLNTVDGNECTSLQRLSDISESCSVKDSVFAKNVRYILENACTLCKKLLYRSQCVTCSESIEVNSDITIDEGSVLCRSCMNCIKKGKVPKNAYYANNLDPGIIPDCLKGLWVVEKRLISLVQLFLTLVVLPGGQTAQKGLAIHFPVDLHLQTQNLFENVIDLENVVILY